MAVLERVAFDWAREQHVGSAVVRAIEPGEIGGADDDAAFVVRHGDQQ